MEVQKPIKFVATIREGNRLTIPKEFIEFYDLKLGTLVECELNLKPSEELEVTQ